MLPFLLEKLMCLQRTALEMIEAQEDHGGMSHAAILLHRKQCEDTERMNKRIDEIENKVDAIDQKINEIKDIITKRSNFTANLKEILSNKVFIYLLLVVTASVCGVSVADLGTFLFKG